MQFFLLLNVECGMFKDFFVTEKQKLAEKVIKKIHRHLHN